MRPARCGGCRSPTCPPQHPVTKDTLIHLLMPLCSSVLVVLGLLFLKRVQGQGISTWTTLILVCWTSAAVFSLLTLLGGTMQPARQLWQPAVVGALFVVGQCCILLAVHWGDVSIATPVQGVKVLLVPAAVTLWLGESMATEIWVASAIALLGIGLVQVPDGVTARGHIYASIGFSLLAAVSMTAFDLLIQHWAPAWGAGYFLPLAFGFSALWSTALLPWADRPRVVLRREVRGPLLIGMVLMSVQAIGMTFTIARFGDATRVNIVYSLRGIFGVILTWMLSHHLAVTPHRPHTRQMVIRLLGALLLVVAILIALSPNLVHT